MNSAQKNKMNVALRQSKSRES